VAVSSITSVHADLPAVDERLVAPGCGYEIEDGEIVRWEHADEVEGVIRCSLGALLHAHRAIGREAGVNLLTRVTERDDLASHACVWPSALDPVTGGRQIEDLAFYVLSTERLARAGRRAGKLAARGVRRVFALDVAKQRAFEWSRELGTWVLLPPTTAIGDPSLAVALPVEALFDDKAAQLATVRAFRAKRDPEFLAEREAGYAEGLKLERARLLRDQLVLRFGALAPELEARVANAPADALARYLERILTATTAAGVFDED